MGELGKLIPPLANSPQQKWMYSADFTQIFLNIS